MRACLLKFESIKNRNPIIFIVYYFTQKIFIVYHFMYVQFHVWFKFSISLTSLPSFISFYHRSVRLKVWGIRGLIVLPVFQLSTFINNFNDWITKLLPTNCLSVFDHFVGLARKGLGYSRVSNILFSKGAV